MFKYIVVYAPSSVNLDQASETEERFGVRSRHTPFEIFKSIITLLSYIMFKYIVVYTPSIAYLDQWSETEQFPGVRHRYTPFESI